MRTLGLLVLATLLVAASPEEQWWRFGRAPKAVSSEVPDPPPTYYVRTDGSNSNDGLTNSTGGAFLTIDFAMDNAEPGDVIRVQAGTYQESVSPAVSGTAGAPITLIADGAVTLCQLALADGKNYLRFIGLTIDTDAGSCVKANRAVSIANDGTTTGVEFWHNTIRDATTGGISTGSAATRSHNYIVIGNTFTNIGCCLGEGDGNSSGAAIAIRGNHNIFAYNTVTMSDPDIFILFGNYQRFLNNYLHMHVTDSGHGDVWQGNSSAIGTAYNIFEGNFILGNGVIEPQGSGAGEHGALFQDQSADGSAACASGPCGDNTENLFRRNVHHRSAGSGISSDSVQSGGVVNTRIVNDTFVDMQRVGTSAPNHSLFRNSPNNGYAFNTLNDAGWSAGLTTNLSVFAIDSGGAMTAMDYNLAHEEGETLSFAAPWTSQANPQNNVDPVFADRDNDDFSLQVTSGAIGTGGPLTVTSGSGTGTTFSVAASTGGWFRGPNTSIAQYGGSLTEGDVITVGTDVLTVASVSGDDITVTTSFTWADEDPVYYGADTTPDIGAYPYKAGGYTLTATYVISANRGIVTPNDASLVRFVVCYDDGRPVQVIRESPYVCNAVSGVFSAHAYPRYASTTLTLWVVATEQ